jgi:excisionase family DNA binding protein
MGTSKLKIPKICPQCGKPFEAKTITTVYCSHYCVDRVSKERKKKALEEGRAHTLLQQKIETTKVHIQERPYITVAEAVVLFGISKNTMHRLIKYGKIPAVNLGERLTRVSKAHMEAMFAPVAVPVDKPEQKLEPKVKQEQQPESAKFQYDLRECYTIIEAARKYDVTPTSMRRIILRSNLPQKKVNTCVYVPKTLIDNIFNPISTN